MPKKHPNPLTVRSGAKERTFSGARLDVLIFRLRSYCDLISYTTHFNGPKIRKTLMFLGQAGMFLLFQARRSSATRSSTSDLTVTCHYFVFFSGELIFLASRLSCSGALS